MQIQELNIDSFTRIFFLDLNQLSCIGREREKKGLGYLLNHHFKEDVELNYNSHGKPFIANQNIHISISHSRNLLALIISPKNVAIDVELISDKAQHVKTKFLNEQELLDTAKAAPLTFLLYWCAKETLFKYLGIKGKSLKDDFFIPQFDADKKEGFFKGMIDVHQLKEEINMKYFIKDNFVVVYTV
jgi:phosphopantetheinyl transferase (holo-ACP synthase)